MDDLDDFLANADMVSGEMQQCKKWALRMRCRYGFWGDATKKCEGKRAFSLASFDRVIFSMKILMVLLLVFYTKLIIFRMFQA